MTNQISQADFESIIDKMELGEEYLSKKNFKRAFRSFEDALEKIPIPKEDWDISLDIYYELGNCSLALNETNNADFFFNKALECPDAFISAKVWMGLGKLYNIQDLINKAQDAFMRAYMLEGKDIFEKDDNKKYLVLIKKYI